MPREIEMDHITVIVPSGKGSDVLKLAKRKGIAGGTVNVGIGTASSELLKNLVNKNLERDIVSLLAPTDMAEIFLNLAKEELELGKIGSGIGYATNVNKVYGDSLKDINDEDREESDIQVITGIIKVGKSKDVMDAARKAGARGGTIITNSDDDPQLATLFSKDEGVDEVILIIARKGSVRNIMEAIKNNAGLENDKGIIYCQDAHFVHGLK
ncbi:MAG: hypothetical protein QMB63_06565 [Clostridiaceae bacterium]